MIKRIHVNFHYINPFHAIGLFLYPLKTSGFQMFSEGIKKETSDFKWVTTSAQTKFETVKLTRVRKT